MKKVFASLLFLSLVFVVAVTAAWFSSSTCRNMCRANQDSHDWIHSQLGLTQEQKTGLDAIEKGYHKKRQLFEQELSRANKDLAQAIRADGQNSDRVNAAIGKIHSSMGKLQTVTIAHVFEMKEVLSPEQYKRLLNFTADALDNLDCQHGGE